MRFLCYRYVNVNCNGNAMTQMNKMSPYSGIFLGDSTARNICASTDEKSIGKGSRHRPDRVLLAPKNSFALSFKRAPPLFLQNLKMTCHSVCRRCFYKITGHYVCRRHCIPAPCWSGPKPLIREWATAADHTVAAKAKGIAREPICLAFNYHVLA
jgi:hypothetical protein